MSRIKSEVQSFTSLKVVGVGGAGGNALGKMIDTGVRAVEFIAIDTDAQALHYVKSPYKIHIGKNVTKGLGTGMDPELGRKAAQESREEIARALDGADMVFITCGLGGGTGTGGAPVIAEISRSFGALTIAVVTKPFPFEGSQRMRIALDGFYDLKGSADSVITIANDRLASLIDKKTRFLEAFSISDDILCQAVQGISDVITLPGIINVDFADVRAIMKDTGSALIGMGKGIGDERAFQAARQAINSPFVEGSIEGACGILFTVSGGIDMAMSEVYKVGEVITEFADSEAKIIFGVIPDPDMPKGELRVNVVATGVAKEWAEEEVREVIEIYHPAYQQTEKVMLPRGLHEVQMH